MFEKKYGRADYLRRTLMTIDERAQLVEDIRVSSTKRRDIVERASLDKEFDIAAAWEELEELDKSIAKRVGHSHITE